MSVLCSSCCQTNCDRMILLLNCCSSVLRSCSCCNRLKHLCSISAVRYPRPCLLRPVATSACPSSTEIALDIPSPCHLATCLCSSQLFVCSFQLPTELHIACSGRVQCSSVPSAVSIHGGILGQMAYVPGGLTCVYREMHCVGLQKNI